MAKGNLFLGMGRGKVGDVVFYRMNGWQMARVRNRNPKNPRSVEQLYQRAIIATVMKSYSMGKEIFDHSFQGYNVGEGCMRRFLSMNSRILREQVATDLTKGTLVPDPDARLVAPKSTSPTAQIGMMVSEGTLIQNMFHTSGREIADGWAFNSGSPETTINGYLNKYNISAGDIFTFLFILTDNEKPVYVNRYSDRSYANQYLTKMSWIRLIVKDGISDEKLIGNTLLSDVFDIEIGGDRLVTLNADEKLQTSNKINFIFNDANYAGVTACIRSRDDMDLRSTEYTTRFNAVAYGISPEYIIEVWQNEVQKLGQSDLILEGGDNLATYNETMDETPVINSPEVEEVIPKRGRTRA